MEFIKFIEFIKKYLYDEILIKGNTYFINQKLLKIISYYLVPIFLLISALILKNINNQDLFYSWSQFTARSSFFLLIFLLYLKPLSQILPNIFLIKKLMMFRRQLGIATFYFGFFHMINAFFIFEKSKSIIDTLIWFKFGAISLLILFIMFLTSNNYSIKLFKRNWKKIQQLIHFSLIILFIHIFLIYTISYKNENYIEGFLDTLSFTFYIILYYFLKLIAYKKIKFNFPKKILNN